MYYFDFSKTPFSILEVSEILGKNPSCILDLLNSGDLPSNVHILTGSGRVECFPSAYDIIDYKAKSSLRSFTFDSEHHSNLTEIVDDVLDIYMADQNSMVEFVNDMFNYPRQTVENVQSIVLDEPPESAIFELTQVCEDLKDVLSRILTGLHMRLGMGIRVRMH
ncbi:hypothetical protein [Falsiphaeobacter marinintestinus]|uniref:hypothetical protein n=1 Tax=Falsiphaeobacter marinintestinus TaxID=1492905 RepID=UPI0011B732D4|nr:hypothetical protein [Phaeobacter marinintestinus]